MKYITILALLFSATIINSQQSLNRLRNLPTYFSYEEFAPKCTGQASPTQASDCNQHHAVGYQCCLVTTSTKSCFALSDTTASEYVKLSPTTYQCPGAYTYTADEQAVITAAAACIAIAAPTEDTCAAGSAKDLACCYVEYSGTKKCQSLPPSTANSMLAELKKASPTVIATCKSLTPSAGTWYDTSSASQACMAVADPSKKENCQAIKFSGNWCCQRTDTTTKTDTCQYYTDAEAKVNVEMKGGSYSYQCDGFFFKDILALFLAVFLIIN